MHSSVRVSLWLAVCLFACAAPRAACAGIFTHQIDVSTAGSLANGQLQTSAIGGDFIASYNALQPTGTGVIQPFLRIQQTGEERGFNTDYNAHTILDDKPGPWTHAIQVQDFHIESHNGVNYLKFLLDVNNANGNANISLNQVQIFLSNVDPQNNFTIDEASVTKSQGSIVSGYEALLHLNSSVAGAVEVFRLNNRTMEYGVSQEIIIAGGHGSGSGDFFFYVNADIFKNASPTSYVTLFSQLGSPPGQFRSSAGFEEWSFLDDPHPPVVVPEPSSVAVWMLIGIVGIFGLVRQTCSRSAIA